GKDASLANKIFDTRAAADRTVAPPMRPANSRCGITVPKRSECGSIAAWTPYLEDGGSKKIYSASAARLIDLFPRHRKFRHNLGRPRRKSTGLLNRSSGQPCAKAC